MPLLKPTPYPDLNEVLDDFVASVVTALGSDFVGAYLQGSFAIGDFDQNSDVDFISTQWVQNPVASARL